MQIVVEVPISEIALSSLQVCIWSMNEDALLETDEIKDQLLKGSNDKRYARSP